jgi:hypothetical protein
MEVTLKLYVYVYRKNGVTGFGAVAADLAGVKEVVNSSLSPEISYRQASCFSLSKVLGIISRFSPLYSSFEIFLTDRFFRYLPGSTLTAPELCNFNIITTYGS